MAKKLEGWDLVGYCGVDSGQLMITDPCYLDEWVADECGDKVKEKNNYSYAGACELTIADNKGGQLNKTGIEVGVVFASGYGDGVYPVYCKKNKDGRVVEVKVVME